MTCNLITTNPRKGLKTNSILDEEKEESPLVINDDDMAEEPRGYQKVISCVSTKSMKALTSVGIEITRDECRCPKVLIVDDDAFNMLAYKSILANLGVKCDCVYSGKSGIDKLVWRANPFPWQSTTFVVFSYFAKKKMSCDF